MNSLTRRDFIRATGLAGAAMFLKGNLAFAQAQMSSMQDKIRGVNLGGWLVLEKWITPGLFAGVEARDEYTLCEQLGREKASQLLKEHRQRWITADDFKWLAACGINAVRLPVGYWVAEENPPFITGLESMDWAFAAAKQHGLSVLLDLHGLPGSQNGWDHSGRAGTLGWHTSQENIAHSLRVIENLAIHCKDFENLLGIELVNEPRGDVPLEVLKSYYQDGCQRIRQHLGQRRTAVIIHDGFRPLEWHNFMSEPEYSNIILDTHLYQCFSDQDDQRDISGQIEVAAVERKRQLEEMQKQLPCMVGEWSLALPAKSLQGLDPLEHEASMRAFGAAQLLSYESTRGWFFWTYRTEKGGGWSFRDCVNRGWLPRQFGLGKPVLKSDEA